MAPSDDTQKMLTAFSENWNHARHVENERLYFAEIYGGIVAGSFAISDFKLESSNPFLWVLYGIGLLGFVITIKLSFEFENHIKKNDKMKTDEAIIRKYMAFPLERGIFRGLKVRYAFLTFYIFVCSFLLWYIASFHVGALVMQIVFMIAVVIAAIESFNQNSNDSRDDM